MPNLASRNVPETAKTGASVSPIGRIVLAIAFAISLLAGSFLLYPHAAKHTLVMCVMVQLSGMGIFGVLKRKLRSSRYPAFPLIVHRKKIMFATLATFFL